MGPASIDSNTNGNNRSNSSLIAGMPCSAVRTCLLRSRCQRRGTPHERSQWLAPDSGGATTIRNTRPLLTVPLRPRSTERTR